MLIECLNEIIEEYFPKYPIIDTILYGYQINSNFFASISVYTNIRFLYRLKFQIKLLHMLACIFKFAMF